MKMFLSMAIIFIALITFCTPAQVRSDYDITWGASDGAVKYYVFLEEKVANTGFQIVDNMDYLDPVNITTLKIGEATSLSYTVRLLNDARYVVAGVVAVDASGFYSVLGASAVTQKGTIPPKPGAPVLFKKK